VRTKLRGRVFRTGDWVHERDLVEGLLPLGPNPTDAAAVRAELWPRLGLGHPERFEAGDLLAAGRGFAVGTRTDGAALRLRRAGFGGVVAASVDVRFRESALRLGLPVLVIPSIKGSLADGDEVIANLLGGALENLRVRRLAVGTPLTDSDLRHLDEARGLELLGDAVPKDVDLDVVEIPATRPLTETR
jgi:3-isopropylmalate/(R)-2-methylmalate dehydratase small subunit